MRDWFAQTFPLLAGYPADKWMMIPMAFIVTVAVLMGIVTAIFENPNQACDPCHDPMMKSLDAYTCTEGRAEWLPDKELAACRRSLGKPEVY